MAAGLELDGPQLTSRRQAMLDYEPFLHLEPGDCHSSQPARMPPWSLFT